MSEFKDDWLRAHAVVPVDVPTTGALVREVMRLRAALSDVTKERDQFRKLYEHVEAMYGKCSIERGEAHAIIRDVRQILKADNAIEGAQALAAYAVALTKTARNVADFLDGGDEGGADAWVRPCVLALRAAVAKGSDDGEVRSPVVGGAQLTQAGGDSGGMPLSVGRSRPDQTATSSCPETCHTDHPLRHWDRTCPACVHETNAERPEPHDCSWCKTEHEGYSIRDCDAAAKLRHQSCTKSWSCPADVHGCIHKIECERQGWCQVAGEVERIEFVAGKKPERCATGCYNLTPGATLCQVCGGDFWHSENSNG